MELARDGCFSSSSCCSACRILPRLRLIIFFFFFQAEDGIRDVAVTGVQTCALSDLFFPMTSVAGDFYDFIQVDDTHLGILIADVSGHGLPSALIASMLQVALTGQAHHAAEPAEVLAGLNRALCGKFTHNFVTAAYVYLDLEKQLMRYAGAGHPPVLQWRNSTGTTSKVLQNGLVLGMFNEATYEALELILEPGDRHVLYTDGVVEAANPAQEEFGADRVMRFMESNKQLVADEFADSFLAELSHWSGQTIEQGQQDDITLLVVDFKG